MVCVVERLRPDALYRLVSQLRSTRGLRLVPADAPTVPVLRGLRDGFAVCLAADRDVTGGGVDTTFFGAPARLPDGYARLARRTGSAVVVALPIRNHDDTITVDALLVETPPPTADVEADIRAIVRAVLAVVEECVAANPGQWVMFQRVWPDARPVVGGPGPARTPVA
jgi:KDO2-lipid IV(A) lauroyltransferase